MIGFRQCDARWPFLWEDDHQPAGRWHAQGDGPVHYFADTSDGAWAELIRHEEITDPDDLATIRRNIWAVEIANRPSATPTLAKRTLIGPPTTYPACQREARRLRDRGEAGLVAVSAALRSGNAGGWVVDQGLQPGPARDAEVIVLFGRRPDLVGWLVAEAGRPPACLLDKVSHL